MYVVRGEEDRESQLVKAISISHSVVSFPGNSGTQTLFFFVSTAFEVGIFEVWNW